MRWKIQHKIVAFTNVGDVLKSEAGGELRDAYKQRLKTGSKVALRHSPTDTREGLRWISGSRQRILKVGSLSLTSMT